MMGRSLVRALGRGRLAGSLAGALVAVVLVGGRAVAQPAGGSPTDTLRQQVERTFDVLPVKNGVALRPKSPVRDVQWVEVTDGTISINGTPVSGAELRDKLGENAGVVIQLSYLDPAARTALFREIGGQAPVEAPDRDGSAKRTRRTDGRFRLGGSITVPADEIVDGDVTAVGGSVHVFGEVDGEVVAIAGAVELGPGAVVRDVTVIGGSLQRDPTARVRGEIVEIGARPVEFAGVRFPRNRFREIWQAWALGSVFALFSTLMRVAALCLLAALVILLGRDQVERISARAAAEPLKAGAIGFLAQLLFLPLLIFSILLLVVTIIGIPLLVLIPFILLGLGIVALVGFTSVAHWIGGLLAERLGWVDRGPYTTTIAGILLVVSPLLLARLVGVATGGIFPMTFGLSLVGTLVEYLAWTIGFGAVALVRFQRPTASA